MAANIPATADNAPQSMLVSSLGANVRSHRRAAGMMKSGKALHARPGGLRCWAAHRGSWAVSLRSSFLCGNTVIAALDRQCYAVQDNNHRRRPRRDEVREQPAVEADEYDCKRCRKASRSGQPCEDQKHEERSNGPNREMSSNAKHLRRTLVLPNLNWLTNLVDSLATSSAM